MIATTNGRLKIAGQGIFDNGKGSLTEYKLCLGASKNLMSSLAITRTGCLIQIGFSRARRVDYMIITCFFEDDTKDIECLSINALFWIIKAQMFDTICRDGWTIDELTSLTKNI